MGRKVSRDQLICSILDPNAKIGQGRTPVLTDYVPGLLPEAAMSVICHIIIEPVSM